MGKVLILGIWIGVQPWLMWPGLSQDVSQRLTLVCCAVALGLMQFGNTHSIRPLPRALGWWVFALLVVLTSHHWSLIRHAAYFEFFQETALFADGITVVIALTWGLWALQQCPAAWFRYLPWAGTGMVCLNLVFALAQWQGLPWTWNTLHPADIVPGDVERYGLRPFKPSGLMGLDRSLAAYGVAWLPVFLVWTPWTSRTHWWKRIPWMAALPLILILFAGKVTAWIGVGVVAWRLLPSWRWRVVSVLLTGAAVWWWTDGDLLKKVPMRLITWHHTVQAIGTEWWRGFGFHPMTEAMVRQRFGEILPGLHSDWLKLAFHAGVVMAGWAAWLWARTVWWTPRTLMAKALQASLAALGVMAIGQSVVTHARLGGLALIFLAWLWHEQQQGVLT